MTEITQINQLPTNALNAQSVLAELAQDVAAAESLIAWAQALGEWARGAQKKYVTTHRLPTVRDLAGLVGSLPAEVQALGDVKLTKGADYLDFNLAPNGPSFPFAADFRLWTSPGSASGGLVRLYEQDVPNRVKIVGNFVACARVQQTRIKNDVRTYNKAAKKIAEAQQLLQTIDIHYNNFRLKRTFVLACDLRYGSVG
jgi:hypothetical protein